MSWFGMHDEWDGDGGYGVAGACAIERRHGYARNAMSCLFESARDDERVAHVSTQVEGIHERLCIQYDAEYLAYCTGEESTSNIGTRS